MTGLSWHRRMSRVGQGMPALCLRLVWGLQLRLEAAGACAGECAWEAAECCLRSLQCLLPSHPSLSRPDCASKIARPCLGALHTPDDEWDHMHLLCSKASSAWARLSPSQSALLDLIRRNGACAGVWLQLVTQGSRPCLGGTRLCRSLSSLTISLILTISSCA